MQIGGVTFQIGIHFPDAFLLSLVELNPWLQLIHSLSRDSLFLNVSYTFNEKYVTANAQTWRQSQTARLFASGVCGLTRSWKNKPLFSGGFITRIRKQIRNYANISVMSSCYYILGWNRMTSYDDQIKAATETEWANESFQVTKSLNNEKHVVGLNCDIWDKNAFFISSALRNRKRCSLIYHPNSFPDSYSLT